MLSGKHDYKYDYTSKTNIFDKGKCVLVLHVRNFPKNRNEVEGWMDRRNMFHPFDYNTQKERSDS